ncbi:hypothetical protein [Profundibacter sp.]|uniref:hypothetical protein n=1 Tax=Profundibacter sp. TaxID=3101071 RepID=UPI003D1491BA
MPTLLKYRQPLPTTLLTAGIVAFTVWVLANYITGTDYLWFRVTSVFALVLLTPAVLEPVAVAITNSPEDRNLRLLYGALAAYIFCLFPIIAFFGYIQYSSSFSKLLLVTVALGVGLYAGRKTPDIPTDIVEIYKPVKSEDRNGFFWFYFHYIFPLLLIFEVYNSLITPTLTDESATRGTDLATLPLMLVIILVGLFPLDTTRPRKKVYLRGKYITRNEDISVLIATLIVLANTISRLLLKAYS